MIEIRKNVSTLQLTINQKKIYQDDGNIPIARKSSSIVSVKRCKSANTTSFRRKDKKCRKQRKNNHFQVKPNMPISPCLSAVTEKCNGDFKPKLKVQFSLPLTTDMKHEQKVIKIVKDGPLLNIPAFKELNKLKLTKSQTNLPNNVSKKSQKSYSQQKFAIPESKTNLAHKVLKRTQNTKTSYQKDTVSDTSLNKQRKQHGRQIKSVKSGTNEYDNLKLEAKIHQLRAKSRKLKTFIELKDNRSQEFRDLKNETKSVVKVINKKPSLKNIIDKTKLLSVSPKQLIRFSLRRRCSNLPVKKHNKNQTKLRTNKYDTKSCKDGKYNKTKERHKTQKHKTSSKSPCSPCIKRNLATGYKYEENKKKPQRIRKLNYDTDFMAFSCNVPGRRQNKEIRVNVEQKGKVEHTSRKQNKKKYQNGPCSQKITFWKNIIQRFLSFSSVEANESDTSSSLSMDKENHYYDEQKESNSLSRRSKNKVGAKRYQRYYTYKHNRDDSIGRTNMVAQYPKSESGEIIVADNSSLNNIYRNITDIISLVDTANSPCYFDKPLCFNLSCQTYDTVSECDKWLQTITRDGIKLNVIGTKTQEDPSLYAWSKGKILKPASSCNNSKKYVTKSTQTPLKKPVSLWESKGWEPKNREGKMWNRKESNRKEKGRLEWGRNKTEQNERARKEWERKAGERKELEGKQKEREKWEYKPRERKELEGNPKEREKWERKQWKHKEWQGKGNSKELDRKEWNRKEQEHKELNGKVWDHKELERKAPEINKREGKEGYRKEWVRKGLDRKKLDGTEWQGKVWERNEWDRITLGRKELQGKEGNLKERKSTQTQTVIKNKNKKIQMFRKKTSNIVNKTVKSKEKRSNETYSNKPRVMQKMFLKMQGHVSSRGIDKTSKRKSEKDKSDHEKSQRSKSSSENQHKDSKNNKDRRSRSMNTKEKVMRSRSTGSGASTGINWDLSIAKITEGDSASTCKKCNSSGTQFPITITVKAKISETNTRNCSKSTVCSQSEDFPCNKCKITPCKKHKSGFSSKSQHNVSSRGKQQLSRNSRSITMIPCCNKCKLAPRSEHTIIPCSKCKITICAKCKKKTCIKHNLVLCQKCNMKPCSKCKITPCKNCTINLCKKINIILSPCKKCVVSPCKKCKTNPCSNLKVCPCVKSKFPCTETCKHHKTCKLYYKMMTFIKKRTGDTSTLIGCRTKGTGTCTSCMGPCIREVDAWDLDRPIVRRFKKIGFGRPNENKDWVEGKAKIEDNDGPPSRFRFGKYKNKGEKGNNGDNGHSSGEKKGENGPRSGRNSNGGDGNRFWPVRNKNKYNGKGGPSLRINKNNANKSLLGSENGRGDNRARSSGYHGENDPRSKDRDKYRDSGRRSWFRKNKNKGNNRRWSEKNYGEDDPRSGRNKYRGDKGPWPGGNYGDNDPKSGGVYGENDARSKGNQNRGEKGQRYRGNKGLNDPRSGKNKQDDERGIKSWFGRKKSKGDNEPASRINDDKNDPRSRGKPKKNDDGPWPGGNNGGDDPRYGGNYGQNDSRSRENQNKHGNGPWSGGVKGFNNPRSGGNTNRDDDRLWTDGNWDYDDPGDGENKGNGEGGKQSWFGRKRSKGNKESGSRRNYDENDLRSGGKSNREDDGPWPRRNYVGSDPRSGTNYGENDRRSMENQYKGKNRPWSGKIKYFNDSRSGGNTNRGDNRPWTDRNWGYNYNDPSSSENTRNGEGDRKYWFGRKKSGDNKPRSRKSRGNTNTDVDEPWPGRNYGENDPLSRGNQNKGDKRPWTDINWGYNDTWDGENKRNGEGGGKSWFGRKKSESENEPWARKKYFKNDPGFGGNTKREGDGPRPWGSYGGNGPRSGGNYSEDDPTYRGNQNRGLNGPWTEGNRGYNDPRSGEKHDGEGSRKSWFARKKSKGKNLGGNGPWAGGNNGIIDPWSRINIDDKDPRSRGNRNRGENEPWSRGNIEDNEPWSRGNRGNKNPWSRGKIDNNKPWTRGNRNRGDHEPWSRENIDDNDPRSRGNRSVNEPWSRGNINDNDPWSRGNRSDKVPRSRRNYGEDDPLFGGKRGDDVPWSRGIDGDNDPSSGPYRNRRETGHWSGGNYDKDPMAEGNRNIGGDAKRSWFRRNRNKDDKRRRPGRSYDDPLSRGHRYDDVDGGDESQFVRNRNNNRVRNRSWFGRNENNENVVKKSLFGQKRNDEVNDTNVNRSWFVKKLINIINGNEWFRRNKNNAGKGLGNTGDREGKGNNIKNVYATIATDVRSMFKSKKKDTNRRRRKRKPIEYNYDGSNLYLLSLREKKHLGVYERFPWYYPQYLSMMNARKQCLHVVLFVLACSLWVPCILLTELFRICL